MNANTVMLTLVLRSTSDRDFFLFNIITNSNDQYIYKFCMCEASGSFYSHRADYTSVARSLLKCHLFSMNLPCRLIASHY